MPIFFRFIGHVFVIFFAITSIWFMIWLVSELADVFFAL